MWKTYFLSLAIAVLPVSLYQPRPLGGLLSDPEAHGFQEFEPAIRSQISSLAQNDLDECESAVRCHFFFFSRILMMLSAYRTGPTFPYRLQVR
jgi:hypothetical protein